MDSPRGRVYQMVQVANGAAISDSYREHIDLCLACRGCESACPSGVRYGRMGEDARAELEAHTHRGWFARKLGCLIYVHPLQSRSALSRPDTLRYLFESAALMSLPRRL